MLKQKIRDRLKRSDLWGDKTRETGTHISGLRCPECGKLEAWTYSESPFTIICNRKNECGARVKALEIFPEIARDIEKEFTPTKEEPDRPAREYLHSRGLSRAIEGLSFQYWRNVRKSGSGAVMFFVGKNGKGDEVWNGRLFNPPPGQGKTHNKGETAGLFWKHPGVAYDPAERTFATEGIIDACSLIEMGFQAIALLSSGQDPHKVDLGEISKNLVMAFDPDSAGAGGLKKWKEHYPDSWAITPVSGDWNDFLRDHDPLKARKMFEEKLLEFELRADLILAEEPRRYAELYHGFYGKSPGLFPWKGVYYYATVKDEKKTPEIKARKISDFTLAVDHFEMDVTNPDEPNFRFFVHVRQNGSRPIRCVLSGADISTPGGIRKAMLERAKAMWEGRDFESAALAKMLVSAKAPVVRQLYRLGHDTVSDAYVFKSFLIDRTGRMIDPDKRGFFRLSSREFIGPSTQLCLNPKKGEPVRRIYELMNQAWPETAGLVFAFVVSSWFVNKVKPELGFFPFCSLWGDTQTGKSRLVRIANAMQALDDEGLPLIKVNTAKGEMRKLAQRSGLFQALIEANREENVRFDFDALLPMYNHGNPIRVTAVKTNDLQTQETPFLSSILFAQNREQFKTKAQMERVISSRKFLTEDITARTREAYDVLTRIQPREIAWTMVEIMRNRQAIEAGWLKEYEQARNQIIREVPDNRIAENHAILLAFHRLSMKVIGVKHDLFPYIVEIASHKAEKCTHREATPADHFFEVLDGLSEEDEKYTGYAEEKDGILHLRMAETLKAMDKKGVRFIVGQLYGELKEHPAFIKSNVRYRGYFGGLSSTSTRVWTFDMRKL